MYLILKEFGSIYSSAGQLQCRLAPHLVSSQLVNQGTEGGWQRKRQVVQHMSVAFPGEENLQVCLWMGSNSLVLQSNADISLPMP